MSKEAYVAAGVDMDAAARIKEAIKARASATTGPQVLGGVGHFGGMYELSGYKEPVLVSSTDNVGTKLKIAALANSYGTVGQDVVNQNVNDIVTTGARPLFFLDYIAASKLAPEKVDAIVRGIAYACTQAGCALIGGETAELPGLFADDGLDLSGFVVGAVEKSAILDGSRVCQGDVLLGVPSSGVHTNGYSLVRKIFNIDGDPSVLERYYEDLGCDLGEALLQVHRPYYPMIEPAVPFVKGLAHITGGSFYKNVPRILPPKLAARLDKRSWDVLPIFRLIQDYGKVSEEEMYRVFNMGLGLVIVCGATESDRVRALLPEARVVGEVVEGKSGTGIILD